MFFVTELMKVSLMLPQSCPLHLPKGINPTSRLWPSAWGCAVHVSNCARVLTRVHSHWTLAEVVCVGLCCALHQVLCKCGS